MYQIVKGDATYPQGDGNKLIIHVCNDAGRWGAGFVLALSKRWPQPEQRYRNWEQYNLGSVQYVPVEPGLVVVNMIAQHGTGFDSDGRPPIRYGALATCLGFVAEYAQATQSSVHAPRFGAGLAGGSWHAIDAIIRETLIDNGIDVTIYDYKP